MEEPAWDTALAPHPAGCCKDRAEAWPDPCDGRGVGHFLRGPAGSGAIGTCPVGEGLLLVKSRNVKKIISRKGKPESSFENNFHLVLASNISCSTNRKFVYSST